MVAQDIEYGRLRTLLVDGDLQLLAPHRDLSQKKKLFRANNTLALAYVTRKYAARRKVPHLNVDYASTIQSLYKCVHTCLFKCLQHRRESPTAARQQVYH